MKKGTKILWKLFLFPVSFYYYRPFSSWKKAFIHRNFFKLMVDAVNHPVLKTRNVLKKIFVALPYALAITIYRFDGLVKAVRYILLSKGSLYDRIKRLSTSEVECANIEIPHEFRYKEKENILKQGRRHIKMSLRGGSVYESPQNDSVDIIIPVYNGLEHLQKLIPSLFAHTSMPHRFIFLDDCSPDKQVLAYLEQVCAGRFDCLIIKNTKNMGFPATVNKGAKYCSGNFVILNTDTEVPEFWLERILRPFAEDSSIASVTPFSNAATIFSFPATDDDTGNRAFLNEFGLKAIDDVFSQRFFHAGDLLTPTAVGFCMAISYQAWREIGPFDSERYGRGYGEEVDWCCRASKKGWKHVLTPNLFVAHYHGGSFTSMEKRAQCARADDLHKQLYPDYLPQVMKHIASDPWSHYRAAAVISLFLRLPCEHYLYLSHRWGGGATEYLEREVAQDASSGASIFILKYDDLRKVYYLQIVYGTHSFEIDDVSRDDFIKEGFAKFSRVVINNLVGWPSDKSFADTLEWVRKLKQCNACRLEFLFHDFFAICPNMTLLKNRRVFCKLMSPLEECQACASKSDSISSSIDIVEWRKNWESLLIECDEVRFFSKDTKSYVDRVFTLRPENCIVEPHKSYIEFQSKFTTSVEPLNIAVVGSIGKEKGSLIIEELADELAKVKLDAKIFIIGKFAGKIKSNIYVTDSYDNTKLPEILSQLNISLCFFSSIWPETFSFVVQELMAIKAPIVAFDIGAPAERLAKYPHGRLIKKIEAQEALKVILDFHRDLLEE